MLIETLLKIPFNVVSRCPRAPTSWLRQKLSRINLSQAASNMILQNHRLLPVSIFNVKINYLDFEVGEVGYWKDFQN
jgi:hypothetical protein